MIIKHILWLGTKSLGGRGVEVEGGGGKKHASINVALL